MPGRRWGVVACKHPAVAPNTDGELILPRHLVEPLTREQRQTKGVAGKHRGARDQWLR